jgi:hypothetical protein
VTTLDSSQDLCNFVEILLEAGLLLPTDWQGKLEESLIDGSSPGSINVIVNKNTLILGTRVTTKGGDPYPIYLQMGTKHMPPRPFVLIGAEQSGPPQFNRRIPAFLAIIANYIEQIALKELKETERGGT